MVFMRPAPMYEHVYSNGMVCLDLLGATLDPTLPMSMICSEYADDEYEICYEYDFLRVYLLCVY